MLVSWCQHNTRTTPLNLTKFLVPPTFCCNTFVQPLPTQKTDTIPPVWTPRTHFKIRHQNARETWPKLYYNFLSSQFKNCFFTLNLFGIHFIENIKTRWAVLSLWRYIIFNHIKGGIFTLVSWCQHSTCIMSLDLTKLRSLVASSLPNSYQFQKQAFYPYWITRAQFWIRSHRFRCLDTETHVKFKLILGWGILGSRFPSPKICFKLYYKL